VSTPVVEQRAVEYPETDGQPMAENTVQFRWIVTIKEGIEAIFRDDPQVFVAGDLFWYPVEGDPAIRAAPDALVVFGRPKGDRGSYMQWEEGGVAPQVVFEVLSPGNRFGEMIRKFQFYERYGVEEYYIYDPDHNRLEGWRREGEHLRQIEPLHGWTSPRLGIRFEWTGAGLRLLRPDGLSLETYQELSSRADAERQRADAERQRADAERQRAERLTAQLRALGIEPEAI
jgi:Uma2 family endonuclease